MTIHVTATIYSTIPDDLYIGNVGGFSAKGKFDDVVNSIHQAMQNSFWDQVQKEKGKGQPGEPATPGA